jgi:hypothetical protein
MISCNNEKIMKLYWSIFKTKSALEYVIKGKIISKISIILAPAKASIGVR